MKSYTCHSLLFIDVHESGSLPICIDDRTEFPVTSLDAEESHFIFTSLLLPACYHPHLG
jgi:hypothetical protein